MIVAGDDTYIETTYNLEQELEDIVLKYATLSILKYRKYDNSTSEEQD